MLITIATGSKVQELMSDLIDDYFSRHLGLTRADAVKLHKEYFTSYGLAIEGLVRHHKIDPLEYNDQVDDALPLETVIKPDPEIRQLLEDIDRSKVTVWLFTNAYVNHGKRVVKLLGIEDLFDGLTFCNYAEVPFVCKPQPAAYKKAMAEAGIVKPEHCFFVGKHHTQIIVVSNHKLIVFFQTIPLQTAVAPRTLAGPRLIWWKKVFNLPKHRRRSIRYGTCVSFGMSILSFSNNIDRVFMSFSCPPARHSRKTVAHRSF